jgi:hypothetical protein
LELNGSNLFSNRNLNSKAKGFGDKGKNTASAIQFTNLCFNAIISLVCDRSRLFETIPAPIIEGIPGKLFGLPYQTLK